MKTLSDNIVELVTNMLDILGIKGVATLSINPDSNFVAISSPERSCINECIFRALGMEYPKAQQYVSDIVGYKCFGMWPAVNSLEDLDKVVIKLYDDVILSINGYLSCKYPPFNGYLMNSSGDFVKDSLNDRDFKIEIIKLPTIGSLNFKY